jgi:hypothetical protein
MTRARWWFQQMRHVVDQAPDWEAVPISRQDLSDASPRLALAVKSGRKD